MGHYENCGKGRNLNSFSFFAKDVLLCPGEWATLIADQTAKLPDQCGIEESMVVLQSPEAKQERCSWKQRGEMVNLFQSLAGISFTSPSHSVNHN